MKKLTANQKAKEIINDCLNVLLDGYWQENEKSFGLNPISEKEMAKVQVQLEKRIAGLKKYLGVE